MGSALPLGEPVPADGSLPGGHDDRRRRRRSASTCTCRSAACGAATATSTPTPPTSCAARGRTSTPTRCCARSTSPRGVLADVGPAAPRAHRLLRRRHADAPPARRPRAHARRRARRRSASPTDAEVTVEANPDTVTDAVAAELAASGVTRLSIGMQSAVPHVLAALDRTHDPANVAHRRRRRAPRRARREPRPHLRRAGGVARRLARVARRRPIALAPDHISAYALIIEDGTKLARQIRRGEVPAPDDDLQADMYELADDLLAAAGYEWYEVSNWARDDVAALPPQPRLLAGHRLVGLRSRRAQPRRRACASGTSSTRRRTRSGSPRGSRPPPGGRRPDAAARALESVLLRTRIREGLPVSELLGEGRHAVAALIADGLVDGPAARARARSCSPAAGGCSPTPSSGRSPTDAAAGASGSARSDPVELALESCECQPGVSA